MCAAVRPAVPATGVCMPTGERSSGQRGVTYLVLLFVLAMASTALLVAAQSWHTNGQRARERELIFRGEQIAQALAAYQAADGVGPPRWPARLDDLVRDTRGPHPRHHLRRLYPDPYVPDGQWALIDDGRGGIIGVHSRSAARAFILRPGETPPAAGEPAMTVNQHRFVAEVSGDDALR